MKFGINQAISQTITQLSFIQLETPSSRLWNFWWIKTYTTFKLLMHNGVIVVWYKYRFKAVHDIDISRCDSTMNHVRCIQYKP